MGNLSLVIALLIAVPVESVLVGNDTEVDIGDLYSDVDVAVNDVENGTEAAPEVDIPSDFIPFKEQIFFKKKFLLLLSGLRCMCPNQSACKYLNY